MRGDRRGVDVGDDLHRVRVAHRHRGDRDARIADLQCLHDGVRVRCERHARRRQFGNPHINRHQPVVFELRRDDAAARLDADAALRAQALLVHEAHEAARAVAALLDFAAVGVEDAVAEIDVGAGRRFDHQHLVAADAEIAVGEATHLLRRQDDRLANGVDNDEVVTEAVHLGETQTHGNGGSAGS